MEVRPAPGGRELCRTLGKNLIFFLKWRVTLARHSFQGAFFEFFLSVCNLIELLLSVSAASHTVVSWTW
jgi:hypothetical protein